MDYLPEEYVATYAISVCEEEQPTTREDNQLEVKYSSYELFINANVVDEKLKDVSPNLSLSKVLSLPEETRSALGHVLTNPEKYQGKSVN